jgi:hypothetical protein
MAASYDFDAVDDFIEMRGSSSPSNSFSGWPVTLSAWINADDLPSGGNQFLNFWESTTYANFFGMRGTFPDQLQMIYGLATFETSSGYSISTGTWYHVAAVFNNDTDRQLYINAVSQVTWSTSKIYPIAISGLLNIGSYGGGGADWDGQIAHVEIHNVALTVPELKSIMYNPSSIDRGLVAYYPMLSGSTVQTIGKDLSGNSYNGTHGNVPTASNKGPPIFMDAGGIM